MKNLAIGMVLNLTFCSYCYAQPALEVCKTLAISGLTDTSSTSEKNSVARSEFDLFCSQSSSFSSNFQNKSSSFKGSFSDVARSIGIDAGKIRNSSYTKSDYEHMCSIGSNQFVSSYSKQISTNTGSLLAAIVSDCVKTASGADLDYVFGTAEMEYDGRSILARIQREARVGAPDFVFRGVNPTQAFETCRVGNDDAIDSVLKKSISISCTFSKVDGKYPKAKKGSFVFATREGNKVDVPFNVKVPEVYTEKDVLNLVRRELSGAVVAFDSEKCPRGWSEHQPSSGRVIVGSGAGNVDEDGKTLSSRAFRSTGGAEQVALSINEMPAHSHYVYVHAGYMKAGSGTPGAGSEDPNPSSNVQNSVTSDVGGSKPHKNMPPYLALTYCIRN